jgi:hypothetical protein
MLTIDLIDIIEYIGCVVRVKSREGMPFGAEKSITIVD